MVVTDVVMPRMGGIELAKRLRKPRPDLPILFVTGYVEQSEALHDRSGHAGAAEAVLARGAAAGGHFRDPGRAAKYALADSQL